MKLQKKQIRLALAVLIVLIGLVFGISTNDISEILGDIDSLRPGVYKVVSISDGDTIVVEREGKQDTVRLVGVDTPETHHPDKPVQCFGVSATKFLEEKLTNQTVVLRKDVLSDNRDIYDRLLRYVYLEDELINSTIVSEGYGFAYLSFAFSKQNEFELLESKARINNKGLWGACSVEIKNGNLNTNPAA